MNITEDCERRENLLYFLTFFMTPLKRITYNPKRTIKNKDEEGKATATKKIVIFIKSTAQIHSQFDEKK